MDEEYSWVVDVTIVADNANQSECCCRKDKYYDLPEIAS